MLYIRTFLFLLILLSTFTACKNGKANNEIEVSKETSPASTTTSGNLPVFTVLDITGKTMSLEDFKGKKIFINLWASWCPPCKAEMPTIEKLYQSVDKEKVVFILLSLDNDFNIAKKYMQSKGFSLPIYYPANNLPELFNVKGIPATFIFNENGKLIQQHEGFDNYDTDAYRQLLKS